MISHPTSAELMDSVIRFIEERVSPQLKDRDAFHARVAVNALAAIKREMAGGAAAEAAQVERLIELLGHDGDWAELNSELCTKIREGRLSPTDPALLAHFKASIIDQVRIDQPNYAGLKALEQGST
ncbi:MAG: protein kinase [Caulobacter sp.]|nr:protein kinase [Caulobacter sp.]